MTAVHRGDVAFEDSDLRCRCGKLRQVDVGAGLFGEPSIVEFCPHCGPVPQCHDWEAGLRAAIRNVLAREGVTR